LTELDSILHQVSRPARYSGGEWNSTVKDWDKTPIRVALSYPIKQPASGKHWITSRSFNYN